MADNHREHEDQEHASEVTLPRELPVLPISEAVIFPAMMVPLVLTDTNLVRLADDCLAGDKILGTFAQRERADDEDGEDLDEADGQGFHFGSLLCHIV